MGQAWIEVNEALRKRLIRDFTDGVTIHSVGVIGAGVFVLRVSSPLLADDCHGCQEVIIEGDTLRFKRWADT